MEIAALLLFYCFRLVKVTNQRKVMKWKAGMFGTRNIGTEIKRDIKISIGMRFIFVSPVGLMMYYLWCHWVLKNTLLGFLEIRTIYSYIHIALCKNTCVILIFIYCLFSKDFMFFFFFPAKGCSKHKYISFFSWKMSLKTLLYIHVILQKHRKSMSVKVQDFLYLF